MSYQSELLAKLEAAHAASQADEKHIKYDINNSQKMMANELFDEYNLSQYDLDESDILRAIKIESILERYDYVFSHNYALKIFYSIAKAGIFREELLFQFVNRTKDEFDLIINKMIKINLVILNSDNELELTLEGKSLAERLGVDIFF
jgi:hypothetical protein